MDFIEMLERNNIADLTKLIETIDDINKAVILEDGYNLNYIHICSAIDLDCRNEVLRLLLTRKDLNVNAKSGTSNQLWTALHIAASCGYVDTLLLMLKCGGDPYITDTKGCNVWDVANEYGNFECINALESYANRELSQKFMSLCISEENKETIPDTDVFDIKELVETDDSDSSQGTIIYAINEGVKSDNETKIYLDKSYNITFVERKHKTDPVLDMNENVPNFDTWTDSMIERKRSNLGLPRIPVTPTTRSIHAKYLYLIENNLSPSPTKKILKYSEELHSFINDSKHNNEKISELEEEFRNSFNNLKLPRNCFTYVLLDPRITNNIQSQVNGDIKFNPHLFLKFIEAIFYIGKGQKSRPMQHLFEARKFMGKCCQIESMKVKRIRDIWSSGRGVVSLNCFHNISSPEALSREFCMLSAIKIENVTNLQRGNNQLRTLKWNHHKRLFFGASLLMKAFYTLLIEGEREIRPADIRR